MSAWGSFILTIAGLVGLARALSLAVTGLGEEKQDDRLDTIVEVAIALLAVFAIGACLRWGIPGVVAWLRLL